VEPDDDLAFALSLADDADTISMARFRATDLEVETKPDLTPVSEADRLVESTLRARIERERPGEAVLGEEEGGDASGWIIDPIDGTRNYTRGIPIWATLIAFEDRVAVVSAPALSRRCGGGRRRSWARSLGHGPTRRHPRGSGRAVRRPRLVERPARSQRAALEALTAAS
jgi:histidinol-phosphatase